MSKAAEISPFRIFTLVRTVTNRQTKSTRTLLGLLFSSAVALLAYRRRSLSRSGVAGTIVAGTTTLGMGGWPWGLSLIFFFVTSSFLSHFREREKAGTATDKFSKGSQRDWLQVAANGGVATALALTHGATTSPTLRSLTQAGYVGALATANADTWATELGVLSPHAPRLITTGQKTTPGTSGGVTLLGTGAAAVGSLSLSFFFWVIQRRDGTNLALPFITFISGLAGSLFDSFLGATVQAMYYCPVCDKETERRVHSCSTKTLPLRGLPWMNNDVVNLLATSFGASAAITFSIPILQNLHRHE
jgi:uncharacterized protein (TIGR00297 family)